MWGVHTRHMTQRIWKLAAALAGLITLGLFAPSMAHAATAPAIQRHPATNTLVKAGIVIRDYNLLDKGCLWRLYTTGAIMSGGTICTGSAEKFDLWTNSVNGDFLINEASACGVGANLPDNTLYSDCHVAADYITEYCDSTSYGWMWYVYDSNTANYWETVSDGTNYWIEAFYNYQTYIYQPSWSGC